MKLSRERLVAGGVGVAFGVAATIGVVAYRNGALSRRCDEEARKIRISLHDTASSEDVEAFERELSESSAVESVEYVSKEEALEELRELYEGQPELAETISADDLPASFLVVAADHEDTDELFDLSSPAIDEVSSGREEIWAECLLNDYVPDRELER